MALEHRYSPRRQVNLEVLINYPALGSLRAAVRDISNDGLFVETGPIRLPIHQRVEITFVERRGSNTAVRTWARSPLWSGTTPAIISTVPVRTPSRRGSMREIRCRIPKSDSNE